MIFHFIFTCEPVSEGFSERQSINLFWVQNHGMSCVAAVSSFKTKICWSTHKFRPYTSQRHVFFLIYMRSLTSTSIVAGQRCSLNSFAGWSHFRFCQLIYVAFLKFLVLIKYCLQCSKRQVKGKTLTPFHQMHTS